MATLTLRTVTGQALEYAELDGNFTALDSDITALSGTVSSLTTTDVPEGINLYFNNTRARDAISVSGDLSYDAGTGIISYTASTDALTLGGNDSDYYTNYTNLSNTPSVINSISTVSINTTAVAGVHYHIDTSGTTLTLPATPSAGDRIGVSVDAFIDTTVARNGSNIGGVADDLLIDLENLYIELVYVNATEGWTITNQSISAQIQSQKKVAFYSVWAEESGNLGTGYNFSFGNGEDGWTSSDGYIVYVPPGWDAEIVGATFQTNCTSGTVAVVLNGVDVGTVTGSFTTPGTNAITGASVVDGDVLNFRCTAVAGAQAFNVVSCLIKMTEQ